MRLRLKDNQIESLDPESLDNKDNEDSDDYLSSLNEDLGFDDFGGARPPMEKHNDLLLKLTNFDPYLQKQIMEWIGMYWDDKEKDYKPDPNITPIMNIKGARWCINFLRTYTRDNNIITTISEDVYRNIMLDVVETTFYNVGTRAEEFGIKKDGDILTVCNQLIHATDLVLIGAGGSKTYSDLLSTTTTRSESLQLQGENRNIARQMARPQGFVNNLKRYMGF